jgi:hypothetical protein
MTPSDLSQERSLMVSAWAASTMTRPSKWLSLTNYFAAIKPNSNMLLDAICVNGSVDFKL